MKFHELKAALQAMTRQEANAVADAANVPQSTVAKIRKGWTDEPRITTVEALTAVIGKRKRKAPIGTPSPQAEPAGASSTATA